MNAGRYINRDNGTAALRQLCWNALKRSGKAATKQSIQNYIVWGLQRGIEWIDLALPLGRCLSSISIERLLVHKAEYFDVSPKLCQFRRGDEPISAIATWATQNLDAAFRPLCMDELGYGVSSALHEVEAVSAAGKKCFFCGPHFLRSKNRSAHSAGS